MKKEKIIDWLLFTLPVLVIMFVHRGVIFFSGIYANQDTIFNYLPYYVSLLRGKLIEYNILGGFPVYTTFQATWFSPITKIALFLFSPINAYIFVNILYVVGSYLFTYLFARKLRFDHRISIIAATVYIFSGQVMLWSHTPLITLYHFSLPLLLYLYEVFNEQTRRYIKIILLLLMGAVLGLGWTSGHVQFGVYVQTFFFVYILLHPLLKGTFSKTSLLKACGVIFSLVVVSFVIGFPQIQSVLSVQPYSVRSSGVDVYEVYNLGYAPYTVIQYFLPSFKIYYPPVAQSFHNYISLLPLVLLICWFVVASRKYTKVADRKYYFFIATFVICFLMAIEKSPLAVISHYLPLYNAFRESVRTMFIGDFALAILLGFILQKITEEQFSSFSLNVKKPIRFFEKVFYYLLIPSVVLVTVIKIFFFSKIEQFLQNYFLVHQYKNTVGNYPLEHYYSLLHIYLDRDFSQLTLLDPQVLFLIIFFFLSLVLLKKSVRMDTKKFLSFAVVLVCFNFTAVYYNRFPVVDKAAVLSKGNTESFILNREKDTHEDYRYLSVLGSNALPDEAARCNFPDLGNWNFSKQEFNLRKEFIDPNINIFNDLSAIDGYEPFMSGHIADMTAYIGSRQALSTNSIATIQPPTLEERISTLVDRKKNIESQNVKYVISPYQINDDDFVQVYAETVNDCKTPIYIYELKHYYPRFFITNNVQFQSFDFKTTLDAIKNALNPVIIINGTSTLSTITKNTPFFQALTPTREDDVVTIPVDNTSKDTAVMFAGLTWLPMWHATIDGKVTVVERANYSSMAVAVPPGKHTVELFYEPDISLSTSFFSSRKK